MERRQQHAVKSCKVSVHGDFSYGGGYTEQEVTQPPLNWRYSVLVFSESSETQLLLLAIWSDSLLSMQGAP